MKPLSKNVEERNLEAGKFKDAEPLNQVQTYKRHFLCFPYSDRALRSNVSSELMASVWNQATRCALRTQSALPRAVCPGNQRLRVS